MILSRKKLAKYLTDLTLYNEVIVTKTVWYWHKDKHVDQWNLVEDLKISTHSDSQLIFDKRDKTCIGKDTQQQILGKLNIHIKTMKLDSCSSAYTQKNQSRSKTLIQKLKI